MSVISGAYSGGYLYQGNLYVHLHAKNIGRAAGGSSISSGDMASLFNQSKKQAFEASKTQYKRLFFNSLSKQSQNLLNQVLNSDDSEIYRNLQNEIGQKVEQALSTDKISKLLQITKKTSFNLIQDALSKSKTHVESFNKILQNFSQAASLLQGQAGANLMIALNHKQFDRGSDFSMGSYLLNAMQDFKKRNNKIILSQLQVQQSQQIIQTFNALGRALKTGETGTGKELTAYSAKRMIDSIFNTGFAESISAQIKNTAYVTLADTFKATLTGSKSVQIQFSNQFGQYVGRSSNQASAGKADAKFNNIQVTLSTGNVITLDIGISDKLYKTNKIQSIGSKVTGVYSSGSGGSLIQAIQTSFHSNNMRYLAVNAIGHGHSGWNEAQEALNEVLLTRQIVRLFASRGGNQDFAQYMFVNGRIVPVYQIILSTLEDIHLSSSLGGQSSQPVTLSISGRKEIQQETHQREKELNIRIRDVSKALNRAKIIAHVNMSKINFENIRF